ncbi:AsmA-like C-terminal region-containing protein [Hoeflea sp. YIM 152468]|nr:AsmA-like C-terminal region-containing protein [Hoeflea sp. YIM 152468]MDF1608459.1 AsmA-like C-terminal region-containing protein [Hoeflea sp. YIM 152468]
MGGLLVLALFAALLAPLFIDWSSYRTAFETEASRIIGQPVKVRGEADARLLPFPSLTFSDVTVGEDDQPAMTIARFSMDAELAPFLSGEVLIYDMRMESPKAIVRILEDGTLDWALKRKPTPPGDLVVLERVTIEDADITILDEQNGRTHRIRDINAVVSAKSLSGPWLIEAGGEIEGQRGAVSISTGIAQANGSIRLRARIVPDAWPVLLETEGDARIEDSTPVYDGLFTFTALSGSADDKAAPEKPLVVAKGDFAATNERLAIKEWRAEVGLADDPYVMTGQATIDTGPDPDFLLIADGQQIDMARLSGENPEADRPREVASLGERLAIFNRLIDRLPPPPLPGRVSFNLPAIVAGDTTLREITLDARPEGDAWLIDRFSANLPGRTTVEARGRLVSGPDAGFNGALTVASTQPSGLANWLVGDVDPVIRRLGAAGFSAQVSLSSQLQRFEALEVAVGAAILKGRLERETPAQGTPSLSLELSGDTFDVDAMRALTLLAAGEDGKGQSLDQYNLAARITADTFTLGDYRLNGFDSSMLWRNRQLTIERMEFADFGGASGAFSGVLEGSFAAPSGTVTGEFAAAQAAGLFALADRISNGHQLVRRLAANSSAFDDLSGRVDLKLDPASGPDLSVTGSAGGGAYTVRAVGTGLTPGGDGPRTLKVTASNPQAYRLVEQAGFAVLPLEGEGPAALTLQASGGANSGDLDIDASFTAPGTEFTLNGNGRIPSNDPITGLFDLAISTGDIEPLLLTFNRSVPQAGTGLAFSMTASLGMNDEQLLLSDIAGRAAGNAFSGELEFDRTASNLTGQGSLKVEEADLGWLGELALGPQLPGSAGASWSDAPFLPPSQTQPEMKIALEADRIDLGRAGTARNFSAGLSMATGTLALENAGADWYGGRLGGSLSLSNAEGAVFLSGRVVAADADLSTLEQAVGGTSALAGKAGARASLEGTGNSMRELVASLAGGGELTAGNLTISGLDPGAFDRILGAADREDFTIEPGPVADLVAGFMTGGELKAESLTLPFTLTGGVMRFSSAEIVDQDTRLSGDARVDLVGLRLEANWQMSFEPGVEAIAGGDPSVVFSLGGLLVDPGVSIDAGQLTNYLSMRAFERERRKVELLQAGVIEKQRLRREIALLKERAEQREAAARARAEAEEAARVAAEEAARLAAEEQQRREEEQAQRARDQQAADQAAAQRAAEEAARQKALQAPDGPIAPEAPIAPGVIERRPLSAPSADPPSAIEDRSLPRAIPDLNFEDLPGVNDPIRSLIAPGG